MSNTNARRLYGDHWDGVLNHEWYIDAPSTDDFEHMLQRLDARRYTMLTLQGDGEQHMAIGGGAGRYVVYATFDNDEFWNLLCRTSAEGIVLLNAGGQEGDFPAMQVVSIEQARAAGHAFLEACRLDPEQRWERQ
jgi:hypothetical protein